MVLLEQYPTYCVLNACRLMYSYKTKDVVISKKASAEWAMDKFPFWKDVISTSLRWYAEEKGGCDKLLLESRIKPFMTFVKNTINLTH
jgi:hypothetical protein